MEITDEFVLSDSKERVNVIAQKLRKLHMEGDTGAVLITQDNDEVIGYITEKEILDAVADGKNPADLKATELMNTDYVEVEKDETLGNIIPIISERYPNAIVVIDDERRCVGYFSKNDYKDAMAAMGVYNKKEKPKNPDDWRTRGIAMSSLGKKIEALKCFEKSVSSKKDREKGWVDLAKRLERIHQYKEAIMCLDKAVTIKPDDDEALIERGNLYSKENTESLAIQSFKKAIKANPDNPEPLVNLAMEHSKLGEFDEAMEALDKAEKISGETAELWFKRGIVNEKAKKLEEAVDCYNRAILINNDYEDAWFNKSIVLNRLGRNSETLQCLRRILEINPNNESAKEAISNFQEHGDFKLF
jgi:tetratricopeptide (TPR) repeat protein